MHKNKKNDTSIKGFLLTMECTHCHSRKPRNQFSYKNKEEKIYYSYCDDCRKKITEIQKKYKEEAKENYEIKKKTNLYKCECGKELVVFRKFHMDRHINTKYHQTYLHNKNNVNNNIIDVKVNV